MAKKSRPPRSGKVVIATKAGTAIWLIVIGAFFGLLGMMLLCGGAIGFNAVAVIFGILLLCVAGTAGGGAYYYGVIKPRLVVTDDALKLIHGRNNVVGYIPLDNIETVEVGEDVHEWHDEFGSHERVEEFVYLVLYDRKDRDSDWPQWEKKRRFDIRIKDDFEESPKWIRDLLQQRMEPYKEERREKNARRRGQEFD